MGRSAFGEQQVEAAPGVGQDLLSCSDLTVGAGRGDRPGRRTQLLHGLAQTASAAGPRDGREGVADLVAQLLDVGPTGIGERDELAPAVRVHPDESLVLELVDRGIDRAGAGTPGSFGPVARYGVHLDRRQFDRLVEVFTSDVVLDYDLVGVRTGLAEATALFAGSVNSVQATQHLMHTTLVEADPAGAVGFVHLTAHHVAKGASLPAPPALVYSVTGTYTDRYVRTSDGWRIAHRHLKLLTTTGIPRC